MTRAEYAAYLETPAWQQRRNATLQRDNHTCRNCGTKGTARATRTTELHVHHLTYKRLGNEHPDDLITLCHSCHAKRHGRTSARDIRDQASRDLRRLAEGRPL